MNFSKIKQHFFKKKILGEEKYGQNGFLNFVILLLLLSVLFYL